MQRVHFILYVDDQATSRDFYSAVLGVEPRLDVPGMTEFDLSGGAVLGLMPFRGIVKLLGPTLPDPARAEGVPRAELYLIGDQPQAMLDRAVAAGATLLSELQDRDWGHTVAYCLDPDTHVLAFARVIEEPEANKQDRLIMTERLRLRPFCSEDAPEVQRLAGEREIADTTAAIPHPYEDGMAETWIAGHDQELRRGSASHWAVTLRESGVLVGAISLMDVDHDAGLAELGYWIGVEHWNNGYCTEAAKAVIDWAFDSLGLNRVHAHHFSRNPSSGKVLKNAGMSHEGSRRQHFARRGRREDIELYGILVADWRGLLDVQRSTLK